MVQFLEIQFVCNDLYVWPQVAVTGKGNKYYFCRWSDVTTWHTKEGRKLGSRPSGKITRISFIPRPISSVSMSNTEKRVTLKKLGGARGARLPQN